MCVEKHALVKETFTNGLNMDLSVQVRVHEMETQWLSGKEKVPGAGAS